MVKCLAGIVASVCLIGSAFAHEQVVQCPFVLDRLTFTLSPGQVKASEHQPLLATERLIIAKPYGKYLIYDRNTFESLGEIVLEDTYTPGVMRSAICIKKKRGGIGTEAKMALMVYAFEHLKIREISATIKNENTASIRLNKKLGFLVATQRDEYAVFSLSRHAFERVREEFRLGKKSFVPSISEDKPAKK